MQDILALATEITEWENNVRYAASLAARLRGVLTGSYIMPPQLAEYDFVPPALAAEITAVCREQTEMALSAAKPFAQWAAARGVGATAWRVAEGALIEVMAAAANWHDLIVLERNRVVSWMLAGQLLLNVDIPCIIVPPGRDEAKLDTIAIAWDASVPCVRALHAALPLLKQASRVLLIDGAPLARPAEASEHIDDYLARHGLHATRLRIDPGSRNAGDAILAAASNAFADLLVMGAYGHNRFSEWVFGGATRHALERAEIPVLMRH